MLKLLVEYGADCNATNIRGNAVIHRAVEKKENTEIVKILLDLGVDVNVRGHSNETPLYKAVRQRKNIEIVKILLEAGAACDIPGDHGRTAVDCAKMYRNQEALLLFESEMEN